MERRFRNTLVSDGLHEVRGILMVDIPSSIKQNKQEGYNYFLIDNLA